MRFVCGVATAIMTLVVSRSAQADDTVHFPRFRWGASLEGGPYWVTTGDSGGLGGLTGRIGVQFTPVFSMYAQATTLIGGGVAVFSDAVSTTVSTEVVATAAFAPMAEVDIGYFYGGLAPEVVFAATAGPLSTSGTFFGLTARAGIWVPPPDSPRASRQGVSVGLDLHTFFLPNAVMVVPMLAIGIEWY